MTVDLVSALQRNKVFGTLSSERLAQLARSATPCRFQREQLIFSMDDSSDALYVILSGRVRVFRATPEGEEVTVANLDAGDVLGEMGVLDGRGRSASAQSIVDVEAARISAESFFEFLKDRPDAAIGLLTVLTRRLRDTLEQVEVIALQNLEERLARLLLRLSETHGQAVSEGVRISIKMSQRDLGLFIATSRESVGRQLKEFRDKDIISLDAGFITVRKKAELERLSSASAA